MVTFVLGLLFALPMGVLANLLTPLAQDRWARRSSERAQRRAAVLQRESERVQGYVRQPHLLQQHLLGVVLATTGVAGVSALFSGLLFAVGQYLQTRPDYEHSRTAQTLYLAGQVLGLVGSLVVLVLTMNALRLLKRVTALKG